MINLKINNIPVSVEPGTTILEAARQLGNQYPHPLLPQRHQRDRRLPYLHR